MASCRGARPINLGDRQVFQNFSPSTCRYLDSSPIVVCQTIARIADGQAIDSHGLSDGGLTADDLTVWKS